MKRFCLALDLKEDTKLIAEYENYHKNVWPEIIKSIKVSGIEVLDIYRTGNRMFMIIEANDDFSFEKKADNGCNKHSKSSGMGKPDVEISTSIAMGKNRREMDLDG